MGMWTTTHMMAPHKLVQQGFGKQLLINDREEMIYMLSMNGEQW